MQEDNWALKLPLVNWISLRPDWTNQSQRKIGSFQKWDIIEMSLLQSSKTGGSKNRSRKHYCLGTETRWMLRLGYFAKYEVRYSSLLLLMHSSSQDLCDATQSQYSKRLDFLVYST